MPESITQWSSEYLPSLIFPLALWTLGAAFAGFIAGTILFFFLRLIRIYRMKFQLGGLVAFLLFLYTVFVTTVAFGFVGFFESVKRQADDVLASPKNQKMLGELSGALTSRSISLAYAYGIQAQETGNSDPDFTALIQKLNTFEKGEWGIDMKKSDAAFDMITDKVVQENYETLYGVIFKDAGGDEEGSLSVFKSILDYFVKSDKLTGSGVVQPLKNTLSELEAKRQTSGLTGPAYTTELKTHAGEKTSDFLTNKVGFMIRTQQIFAAIFGAIALAVPIFIVVVIKILVKVASNKPKSPQAT